MGGLQNCPKATQLHHSKGRPNSFVFFVQFQYVHFKLSIYRVAFKVSQSCKCFLKVSKTTKNHRCFISCKFNTCTKNHRSFLRSLDGLVDLAKTKMHIMTFEDGKIIR